MAGNTLGDLLKAGQLDLLKQVSADSKSAVKKPVADTGKNKTTTSQTPTAVKSSVAEDYKIFSSWLIVGSKLRSTAQFFLTSPVPDQ